MDTGIGQSAYSIMEQGKIDQLLSSKPEDRRAVFEEAAGITKFKTQKREAIRKLEYTDANLLRVTDIIAGVKRQITSMQRQAAKARRYQEIHRDARVLDTHLARYRFTEWSAEKSELTTSATALNADIERLGAELAGHEGGRWAAARIGADRRAIGRAPVEHQRAPDPPACGREPR